MLKIYGLISMAALISLGCGDGETEDTKDASDPNVNSDTATDADTDVDTDTDTDVDMDTDADTDTDTDTDTDSDGDAGLAPDSGIDGGCDNDLGCLETAFCDEGRCVDDICEPGASRCDGDDVLACDANGGGEFVKYTCRSDAHFESGCVAITSAFAGCSCEDDWDCPNFSECVVDVCEGTGKAPDCSLEPEPFASMLPVLEIEWGGESFQNRQAKGSPFPESAQTVMSPIVANLDDDNGDGLIDERDFPEIIFATFVDTDYKVDGVLRAIHGGGPDKGADYFAACGEVVWHEGESLDVTCDIPKSELNPTASLAVGDLDYDGVPEIVAVLERPVDGIAVYNNVGDMIFKAAALGMDYNNPAPALANLDYDGFAEIVVGKHVFTLEKDQNGTLMLGDHFQGELADGAQGQGPISCVADLTGDARQEIIAGATVYALPGPPPDVTRIAECNAPYGVDEYDAFCAGRLLAVWDGSALDRSVKPEGFCAVADILGVDQTIPPGPDNPLDGLAEVITISDGTLQILNGQDGTLRRRIALDAGDRGGAPNVDDFDGDGFPEVGAALQTQYLMIDLQEPTEACPEWPIPFDDDLTGLQGNPARNTPCLHNGWRRLTQDGSSRVTGSSVFDFNGDHAAEVIYNDECYFRIYDGTTGNVLFREISPSRTRIEYPIVADVDNDGNAEIVFATSNESMHCHDQGAPEINDHDYNNGLEVWGDSNDLWVSARRIWNQHAYHVTNITESGAIPMAEPKSWLVYNKREYNTYRSNPRSYDVAPDLLVRGVQVSSPDATCGELSKLLDITARVENAGDLRVGPGVVVSFVGIWSSPALETPLFADPQGTPLDAVIGASLDPGDAVLLSVRYDSANNTPDKLPDQVKIIVDSTDLERECAEDNNTLLSDVNPGEALPDVSIALGDVDDSVCPAPEVETTVLNLGSAPVSDVVVRYYLGDPEQGGTLMHETILPGTIDPGDSVTFFEAIPDFPLGVSVTIYGWVDPENTVEECNDGNNIDDADDEILCKDPGPVV